MSTPTPLTPPPQGLPAVPWYHSPVMIAQVSSAVSGLIALSPHAGWVKALGLTDPQAVESTVTLLFGAVAGIAQVVALIARARSTIQPVTLTQTGADLHPNTLAANVARTGNVAGDRTPPTPVPPPKG